VTFIRQCPQCGKDISYKHKDSCNKAEARQTLCRKCIQNSPETRAKLSNTAKKRWADPDCNLRDPDILERRAEAMRKHWENPDSALNQANIPAVVSRAMKKYWNDPVWRETQIVKISEAWDDLARRDRQADMMARAWRNPASALGTADDLAKRTQAQRDRYARLGIDYDRDRPRQYELQLWSRQIRERDEHTCQECGVIERLHAHHIKPKSKHPELALDLDNGITLCVDCHEKKHLWLKKYLKSRAKSQPEVV